MFPRPALLATPLVAGLLVALTACSTPAAAPASSAASALAAAKPSPTASRTAAVAASGPIDACKLLPAATVARIMGLPYEKAETTSTDATTSECDYDTATNALAHLVFEIQLTDGKQESSDDQAAITFAGDTQIPLTGLGDSAYEAPEGSDARIEKAFGALWGDTYATVGGPVKISETQARQLLTAAHAAL